MSRRRVEIIEQDLPSVKRLPVENECANIGADEDTDYNVAVVVHGETIVPISHVRNSVPRTDKRIKFPVGGSGGIEQGRTA